MSLAASLPTRTLGRTGLELTTLGFGSTGLGNLYRANTEDDALGAVQTAYDVGIRYFDTAPLYGFGLAEHRLGTALRRIGADDVLVSTKVGWVLKPRHAGGRQIGEFDRPAPFLPNTDYSYDGVMRSFEDSLHRLNIDHIDILLVHDADRRNHGEAGYRQRFAEVMEGAYRALLALREQKLIRAFGAGVNEWEACEDFANAGDFDCFLLASRYTLLEQEALTSFLPLCEQRGIGIILGGPYNSGILATGPVAGATYEYAPAPPAILERVGRIQAVCARHGVPLPAAALQFPLLHPAITTVIPGARSPAEVRHNLDLLAHPIPPALWQDLRLEGLIRPDAPVG